MISLRRLAACEVVVIYNKSTDCANMPKAVRSKCSIEVGYRYVEILMNKPDSGLFFYVISVIKTEGALRNISAECRAGVCGAGRYGKVFHA